MTCAEFLEGYTQFRDGLLISREFRQFEHHLACCAACRKYDTAVKRGVQALRESAALRPSPDFRRRLEQRLREVRVSGPELPARAGIAAALFVAVALTLLALEGVRRPDVAQAPALPPVPFPRPVAHAGLPFVSFQDPRTSLVPGHPSTYASALVEPATGGR